MKFRKLLIFLIAASLVSQSGGYTVFAKEADAAVSVSASSAESVENAAQDSTVNPAESEASGESGTSQAQDSTSTSESGESIPSETESGAESGAESGDVTVTESGAESGAESTDPNASGAEGAETGTGTESGAESADPNASGAEGAGTESGAESTGEAAPGTEGTESTAEGAVIVTDPALTDPAAPVEETTPEEIAEDQLLEEEQDLTPVWHPEWQGRGAEFELHPFKLVFPVYVRTGKELYVYDREEAGESHAVARIAEGAYIRLIEGDASAIGSAVPEEVQVPEEAEEAALAESADETVVKPGEDGEAESADPDAESADEAETESLPPMWVYVEAMDAEGKICRGYADGNLLVAARSFDNDLSKVEILKSREKNEAFYANYITTYRVLRDENPVSEERIALVNYGLQFLGNPYVWGGESLTEGCDCSGFAGGVYRHFGYDLPRCSYEMCYVSEKMNPYEAQPGDLLFFANEERVNHVMICLSNEGDGTLLVVEAKGRKWGIVVSRVRCERIVWSISILDGENKNTEKNFVEGKQLLKKPVKQLA